MKNAILTFIIPIVFSCSNQEMETLRTENKKLKHQNDSLQDNYNRVNHIPYINVKDFYGSIGEECDIHFLAVKKGGYVVDSIEIEKYSKREASKLFEIENDHFGSYISFNADTAGEYQLRAYTRLLNDTHTVVQSFFAYIKPAPNKK
jgi:hypothetical protein